MEETEAVKKSKDQLIRELSDAQRRITELEQALSGCRQTEEEKRELEKRLGESRRMDVLGRLASEIAHDLNNMLYPIIIDAEVLLEDLPEESSAHQILKQVLSAAYRQKDLVNQIFSFSRRGEQERSPIRIIPVIQETLALLRSSLPDTIELRQHTDVPYDTVKVDPLQIRQIVTNLFRNAAEAIGQKPGTIEVALKIVHLEPDSDHPYRKAGEYLALSVSDTGAGMPPEMLDHVFDPSFTSGGAGRGTGLGLAITREMVRDHGGSITVDSAPGKGSRFTVSLPVYGDASPAKRPEAGTHRPAREKKRILLVDDEDIILSSIQRVLRRLGYDVTAVNDSVEALDMFSSAPQAFDLVITDLTMPRMTGAEFTSRILAIRRDTPGILSTGFSDVMDERKAREMGVREFLMKPAGINDLKNAIKRSLESEEQAAG